MSRLTQVPFFPLAGTNRDRESSVCWNQFGSIQLALGVFNLNQALWFFWFKPNQLCLKLCSLYTLSLKDSNNKSGRRIKTSLYTSYLFIIFICLYFSVFILRTQNVKFNNLLVYNCITFKNYVVKYLYLVRYKEPTYFVVNFIRKSCF